MSEIGECYKSAFVLVAFGEDGWTLCHGEPIGAGPENGGQRFGHAWAERPDPEWGVLVRDTEADRDLPQVAYYALGRIDETSVRRYDRMAAMRAAAETEHYGPWEEAR